MKKYLYTVILICSLAITACHKEDIQQDDMAAVTDQRVQLTLNLPMPQMAAPHTYAMSANDENEVAAVDVLAFKVVSGRELFAYRKQGSLVTAGSTSQARFYADLVKGTENYRFVVLCNSREEINNAAGALTVDRLKSEVLAAIVKIQTAKWNAVSSGNFTPIPMWGESDLISGVSASTASMAFTMLRSVASIDITLSGAASSNFLITSVSLYNSSDRGVIAPLAANYNAVESRVTQPSLASDTKPLPMQDYVLNAPALNYSREIYVFESAAAGAINTNDAAGLVIGGRYNGSSVTTYYRVDMVNSNGEAIALLRNYRYTVNIVKVNAAGLPTKDQAWKSKNRNLSVNIGSWNEANLPEVNIAEAYDLAVGQDAFQDNGGRKRLAVNLRTSYSGGWTVTSSTNWIVPAAANGPAGNQDLSFNVTSNATGAVRTGMLTFRAGKFSKTVKVTQAVPNFTDIAGIDLYIAKTDLPGSYNWYQAANVPYAFNSRNDPMQNQVVPARQGSCAQVFGEGWRLPNYNELERIIEQKQKISNISTSSFYWSSQYYPIYTTANYAYIHHGGGGDASGVIVSGSQKTSMIHRARCVMTIPL